MSIIKGLAIIVFVAAGLPGAVLAEQSAPQQGASQNYQSRSDHELTELAAQWDALDTHERRALLTEMKARMARGGKRGPVLQIRSERRYGRIIRQPDGRVIHIETNVVQVRPVTPEMLARAQAQGGFGVGFERRVAGQERQRVLGPKFETESPLLPDDSATSLTVPVFKASDGGR